MIAQLLRPPLTCLLANDKNALTRRPLTLYWVWTDWWFVADLSGNDGWCPAAFLDPLDGPSADADPAPAAASAPEPSASGGGDAPPGVEGRYVRAAYDNEGAEEDELNFNEGDRIFQIQDADEYGWSRGILNGVEGIYPAAYVEEET